MKSRVKARVLSATLALSILFTACGNTGELENTEVGSVENGTEVNTDIEVDIEEDVTIEKEDADILFSPEEVVEAETEATTEVEAETEKIKAETAANVAKIEAEAKAEVKKIEADAEAYKVETEKSAIVDMIDTIYTKYQSSLSYEQCAEIVLQTIFYEKWDGKLPEVLTSDSLSSLIGFLVGNKE